MSRNCQGILVSGKCMNPEDSPTSLSDIALFQFQNIMSLSKLNDVIILSPGCSFVLCINLIFLILSCLANIVCIVYVCVCICCCHFQICCYCNILKFFHNELHVVKHVIQPGDILKFSCIAEICHIFWSEPFVYENGKVQAWSVCL